MIEVWGQAPDGSDVQRITLKRGGLSATVISFGAILQDLRLEGHASSLVLGFDTLEAYTKNPQYFGAIVGRFAGRIAGASAEIDGVTYPLDCNFIGKHQLHGGSDGASFRNWALEEHGPDFATFTTILPDRHMGFPGAISLRATYRLLEDATLQLDLEAQTDAPTLCNLTSHNYFTLDGGPDLSHHTLEINAARYIPVDDEGIPSSGVMDVADSAFDYRTARALAEQNQIAVIDHCFCTGTKRVAERPVARITSNQSGLALTLSSTEPGLQVFTGSTLTAAAPFAAIALEPQGWTDAPHHPDFPSAILRPGQTYLNRAGFAFGKA